MTDEAWIEQSLARLESLEAQKAQYEAAGQPVPAEIDEEIGALYGVLKSAADDAPAAPAPPAAAAAPSINDPFPAPAGGPVVMAAASPVASMSSMSSMDDEDLERKGKGGLIAAAAVVLLAAGGGGFWYMNQQGKAPEVKPQPPGETKVISASSVPEDTQEPQAAKGGAADKTPGTEIPEGGADPRRPTNGGGGGGGGAKKTTTRKPTKSDDGRKVKIDSDNRDPLAGI